MHRLYKQTALLLVFSAVFLSPPDVMAVNEREVELRKRINIIEKEIENRKNELEKEEKKLKSQKNKKKKALGELEHTEKTIEVLQRNLWKIRKEEKYLKTELSSAQKEYDDAVGHIKEHSEEYSSRLKSMYKRQNVSALEILFSTDSSSSFLWGLKMLSILAMEDIKVLGELRAKQDTIRTAINNIKTVFDAKVALSKTKRREEKKLSNTVKKQKTILSEYDKVLEFQEYVVKSAQRKKEELQKEMDRLTSEIAEQMKKEKIPVALRGYNFTDRKGKLIWPVSGKVVSKFGLVVDKITKTKINNRGIEILTTHGEPVRSIGKGQVAMTDFIRGYGNFVIIYHPKDYYSIYGHLADIFVNGGDILDEGTIIGSAGSTGLLDDSEARLKLEIRKGSRPENPLSWLKSDSRRISQK